jgi:hypothetical protein
MKAEKTLFYFSSNTFLPLLGFREMERFEFRKLKFVSNPTKLYRIFYYLLCWLLLVLFARQLNSI